MGKRNLTKIFFAPMRFLTIIALIALAKYAQSTSCAGSMYCMGCSATDVCDACFNWGSGKVGARSLASNTCTASLTRTADNVMYYSGTHTNTSNWLWYSARCKSGKTFDVDSTSTAPYTVACNSTGATAAVGNCEANATDKITSNNTSGKCLLCKKNYIGNSTYGACTTT